eukprot:10918088-Ditylum_brightwellii.AAC.1
MLAIGKGPHLSAMMPNDMKLVHEDVQYQVEAGFCEVCTRFKWGRKNHQGTSMMPPSPCKTSFVIY